MINTALFNLLCKPSAAQVQNILVADVILHDWHDQCMVPFSNIKAFFSLTPIKITELLDDGSGTNKAMELECRLVEMTLLEDEENMGAEEPEEQVHNPVTIDSVGDN